MRALMCFAVQYAGIRLKVRLLANFAEVQREYEALYCDGSALRRHGKMVEAFFMASNGKYAGTVVLPSGGNLAELIPHEVTHAVMHKLVQVNKEDDERLATAVGMLSARIRRRVAKIYHIR